MNRRHFLVDICATALVPSALCVDWQETISLDDRSWKSIARCYPVRKDGLVNLNSGSAGNMPLPVEKITMDALQMCNRTAPYQQKIAWGEAETFVKMRLGEAIGGQAGQVYLMRNTTESLDAVLTHHRLSAGEYLYHSTHDYPHGINAMQQRSVEHNVPLHTIEYDLEGTDEQIVQSYAQALQAPGLLLLTHVQHRTGRVLPVAEIVSVAHEAGVRVLLDAAHSMGHIEHSVAEMGCDYYCTSLHKWLSAPLGTGLLWVHDDQIDRMPTRPAAPASAAPGLRWDYMGTHAFYLKMGITAALDWQEEIGGLARKQARLSYLTQYWTQRLADQPMEIVYAPAYGAVAMLRSDKYSASKLLQLLREGGFHAKTVGNKSLKSGVRISTNLFVTESDLDRMTDYLISHH